MVLQRLGRRHDHVGVRFAPGGDRGAHEAEGRPSSAVPVLAGRPVAEQLVHGLAHQNAPVGQHEGAHAPAGEVVAGECAEDDRLAGARGRLQEQELPRRGRGHEGGKRVALVGTEREHEERASSLKKEGKCSLNFLQSLRKGLGQGFSGMAPVIFALLAS